MKKLVFLFLTILCVSNSMMARRAASTPTPTVPQATPPHLEDLATQAPGKQQPASQPLPPSLPSPLPEAPQDPVVSSPPPLPQAPLATPVQQTIPAREASSDLDFSLLDEPAQPTPSEPAIVPADQAIAEILKAKNAAKKESLPNTPVLQETESPVLHPLVNKPSLKNPDLFPQQDEKKDIHLNFEGAELQSFIDFIAEIRGMNIIPNKAVAGSKISLNFSNPVSKAGAWNTFVTILEMANFSIIKKGSVYEIVPKDKKLRQPLPTFIGIKPEQLPDTDLAIRYLTFLENISIQDVQPLLQSMLGQPHTIIPQDNVNGFVIIDKASNIKSAMMVLRELDQTGLQEAVDVLRLQRANASDVKSLFDSLIKKPDGSPLARLLGKQAENSTEYFSPSTKMIIENRTNSLIMLGTRDSLNKIREFIVQHIDTDLRQAESPLHIYELQHTGAKEIVEILREVTSPQNLQSQVGQQAAKYGAVRDGVKFFKGMTFQADTEGNRLLVSCTDPNDWKLLKKTIRSLDTAQPQVVIQTMIVTVTAKKVRELGGQLRNKTHNTLGKNIGFQSHPIGSTVYETDESGSPISLLGNLVNSLTLNQGSSVLSIGKAAAGEGGLWGVFKALSTETDATVLSQPFMTVANRTSSTLVVGESTYITTQEAVGATGNSSTGQQQERADTTITMTPLINMDGVIKLDVDASIEEFVPDSGGTAKQTKKLKTSVTVANGQVLALGGMVKTKVTESGGATPLLSSIPILGWLTKNKSRNTEKEYVFLFICPTIIKPRTTPGMGMYTKMKLHKAASEVEDAIKTRRTNDPIHNFFFNSSGEGYSHKVIDFANARYQPNNVDVRYDPLYRSESSIKVAERLDVDSQAASPSSYWQSQELAPPIAIPAAPSFVPPTQPKQAVPAWQSQPIPAVQPTGPESVLITSPVVAQPEPTPAETKQITVVPQPANNEQASSQSPIDQSIEQRRAQLRSLLSGGSITELLSKAPQSTLYSSQNEEVSLPKDLGEQATNQQETAPSAEVTQAPAQPEEAKKPHEQESFMLSRRQGIKSLLSAPDNITPPQQTLLSQAGNSHGLRSFLGNRA